MTRFQIAISRRTDPAGGPPITRQHVLDRFGAMLATVAAALLAVVVTVTALVLGYFIAGFVIAAILVVIFVALIRSAFRALRR